MLDKKSQPQKLTKAEIKKNQEEALMKTLEKKYGKSEIASKKQNPNDSSDDDSNPPLEPNINHIQREKALEDAQKYSEVIDG